MAVHELLLADFDYVTVHVWGHCWERKDGNGKEKGQKKNCNRRIVWIVRECACEKQRMRCLMLVQLLYKYIHRVCWHVWAWVACLFSTWKLMKQILLTTHDTRIHTTSAALWETAIQFFGVFVNALFVIRTRLNELAVCLVRLFRSILKVCKYQVWWLTWIAI